LSRGLRIVRSRSHTPRSREGKERDRPRDWFIARERFTASVTDDVVFAARATFGARLRFKIVTLLRAHGWVGSVPFPVVYRRFGTSSRRPARDVPAFFFRRLPPPRRAAMRRLARISRHDRRRPAATVAWP
jgi:hypothetical protein